MALLGPLEVILGPLEDLLGPLERFRGHSYSSPDLISSPAFAWPYKGHPRPSRDSPGFSRGFLCPCRVSLEPSSGSPGLSRGFSACPLQDLHLSRWSLDPQDFLICPLEATTAQKCNIRQGACLLMPDLS